MSTNHLSLLSSDDIQAMLDNVSRSSSPSLFAAGFASCPGESFDSILQGGDWSVQQTSSPLFKLRAITSSESILGEKSSQSMGNCLSVILFTDDLIEDLCCAFIGSHKGYS